MTRFSASLFVCCLLSGLATCRPTSGQESDRSDDRMKLRVGTFDSRLIATAYVRSEAFERRLSEMRAELENAKAAGDQQRIKQLEAEGPALQKLIHQQGFSTWPVDDILATIKDELPGIAKQANVDLIISKWDIVFQRTGMNVVDITDLMVVPFGPDDETRKVLESLRKQAPVSLDQLQAHE